MWKRGKEGGIVCLPFCGCSHLSSFTLIYLRSVGTEPGPIGQEGKEGPGTRLKRERGANSTEMMLLTTAGADSLPSEEFNTTLPSVTETHFTEHQ